jgi:hypothetical protein
MPASGAEKRRRVHAAVEGFWWLIVVGVIAGSSLLGGFVGFHVVSRNSDLGLLGLLVGGAGGLVVVVNANRWLHLLRRWRLRRGGIRALATIATASTRRQRGPRAGTEWTVYTVHVRWRDPTNGIDHEGARVYRLANRDSMRAAEVLARGAHVPVVYAPGTPDRFLIDLPLAPTLADQVL